MEYLTNIGAILAGLTLLVIGGEFIVKGAVAVALHYNVPTMIIGLTIIALGTSAPEIVVSINAALDNHPDIALGNIIGSNISNILLVLGLSALVADILVDKKATTKDLPFLLIITCIFIAMCMDDHILSYFDSIILLLLLILYFTHTIRGGIKNKKEETVIKQEIEKEIEIDTSKNTPLSKSFFYIILSIILLAAGAEILVYGAVSLAQIWGISEAVIGLTIVAIGSSSPEIATCVVAAYHKHSDLIAGNIIGSNLLNIMAGLGIAGIIAPLSVNTSFTTTDNWIMLAATILLMICAFTLGKINRATGFLLIISYIGFISMKF